MKVIENCRLDIRNLTSIGADNTNVNYGEHHSVFKLFKDISPNLAKGARKKINFNLFLFLNLYNYFFKGNCYAHILHNGVKHGHDDLSIDVELILYKIYSSFSNSAKRTEELKSYYDFVQVEYRVSYLSITNRNDQ